MRAGQTQSETLASQKQDWQAFKGVIIGHLSKQDLHLGHLKGRFAVNLRESLMEANVTLSPFHRALCMQTWICKRLQQLPELYADPGVETCCVGDTCILTQTSGLGLACSCANLKAAAY